MFSGLAQKFQAVFAKLAGEKKLTEENIADAVREVRLALLDADVSYSVASQFVKEVKEKALGEAVLKAVRPQEQFIKIVHDELVALLGDKELELELKGAMPVILLCGLQGSGKTTQAVKLADYLKRKGLVQKPLIAACDLARPAAILQLQKLASLAQIPCFSQEGGVDPIHVASLALAHGRASGADLLIIDTAGRLHVDAPLMEELCRIRDATRPSEVLFVASAAMGQEAAKIASEFHRLVGITGVILTMLDGNARAGSALSIRSVTGRALIKFEGIGEKIEDLQLFNPESMASRLLGMGDVINLVRKAEEQISEEEQAALAKKLKKASFTYEDYLKQMRMMRKMGPLKNLLQMLPGVNETEALDAPEAEFNRAESIILSMTSLERQERVELIPNRRRRIASGSGTSIDQVNRMVKDFKRMKMFFKEMPAMEKQLKNGNTIYRK